MLIGLGAIGGLMAALSRAQHKTLDYLNQQGKKLRETTEGIVEKGKELMSHRCCSVDATTEAQKQAQEERREHLGR